MKSFLAYGYQFVLYTYEEVDGLPEGVCRRDASGILPQRKVFKHQDSYAQFSDIFRYRMLRDKGGCWVDLDVVCLKTFDFTSDYVFSSERRKNAEMRINTGIIKVPRPGSRFARAIYRRAKLKRMRSKFTGERLQWVGLGPQLMAQVVEREKLLRCVKPPDSFCPVDWFDLDALLSPHRTVDLHDSYAVHLWDSMWSRRGLDRNGRYEPNSLLETLKRKYDVP
jgi:mannosyltransferase OCH1-like enzyme